MKTLYCITAASALALLLAPLAPAAVISRDWKTPGDGLLTYDDVNQREWLDLTESRLSMFAGATLEQRYQNALSEFGPGGRFVGFTIAKSADVVALAFSAGIDAGSGNFLVNDPPTRALISYVDSAPITTTSGAVFALGAVDQIRTPAMPPSGVRVISKLVSIPTSGPSGQAGVVQYGGTEPFETPGASIWLYRSAVPEPRTLITGILACLAHLRGIKGTQFN